MSSSFSEGPVYRPGIVASRDQRIANAHMRSKPLLAMIESMPNATVPEVVAALNAAGYRASRGGPVTHNTVTRAMARAGQEPPVTLRGKKTEKLTTRKSIRARGKQLEVFRTPAYVYTALIDSFPEWFAGKGCDPSAGDGRMLRAIITRGNDNPHWANDIRQEDAPLMTDLPDVTIGDYLEEPNPPQCDFLITNPPFSKAVAFVNKARAHVAGPICILQSLQWQGSQTRSKWFEQAGLAHILRIAKRPQWEVDTGAAVKNNFFDYAWYVFLPDHIGGANSRLLPNSDGY